MFFPLFIPAFVAGVLTFLAPCTLPLVPGYIGFLSGLPLKDTKRASDKKGRRRTIVWNAVWYVAGFTLVFMLFGALASSLGLLGLGHARPILERIAGAFVFIFGMYMTRLFRPSFLSFLDQERHVPIMRHLVPGKALSSFLFGAAFAIGWTPCIGPILGSILLLASSSGTVLQGSIMLGVFSLGLGAPFLLVALFIGQAAMAIKRLARWTQLASIIGGLFIACLGLLMLTGHLGWWTEALYGWFPGLNTEHALLNHL